MKRTMRRLGLLFTVLLALSGASPATGADWAANYGGTVGKVTWTQATAVDASGNVYITGYFNGDKLTLGGVTLTGIGNQDAFVAKLDSSGTVLWAKNYGGAGATALGEGIAVDGSGNVYLGGYFQNADLTTPALTKIGSADAFVIKLDSSGNTTWAKNYGGSGAQATGNGIAVDGSGNVYLAGSAMGDLTTPSMSASEWGVQDAFLLRLDSSGNTTAARRFGEDNEHGPGPVPVLVHGQSIAVDEFGYIYLGGYFEGVNFITREFDLLAIGSQDAFVIKLDWMAQTVWAKNYGGSEATTYCRSITLDGSRNIYLGGHFQAGNLTTPVLTKIGSSDAFAIKLDTNGTVLWAKNYGGSGAGTVGNSIAIDGSGNVYLGGHFQAGNLTTPALTKIGVEDVFAIKLDSSGNTTWSKNYGGSGANAYGYGIAVDGSGNVYLGGYFSNADLTTPALTKIGVEDAFAIKLDSVGNITWSKSYGSIGNGGAGHITATAVDTSSNVYVAGYFSSATFTLGGVTLINIGTSDAFAAKIDSSGTVLWAKNYGGSGAGTVGNSIAVDGSGNVYLGGYFLSADLTTPALAKIGISDAFAIKLDSSGNTTWAKNYGGSGAQATGNSIAVDGSGNVYLGGYFSTASLTTPALTKIGTQDAFAIKLNSSGSTTWSKNYGGSGAQAYGYGIAVDVSGNVYLGGYFTASLTTPALTKIGTQDAFAIKLNSSGSTTWSKNYGGSGARAYGYGIVVDGSGNVYLGGYFNASLTTPALTIIGSRDVFAIKLDSSGSTTWAKNYGGSGANTYGQGIALDGSGNAHLSGYFLSADLTTPSLAKIGTQDAFAIKLDSSGSATWSKNYGGSGAGTVGNSIAVDGSGNVYLGGYFQSANLTTPALTKIGTQDAFILKNDLAAPDTDPPNTTASYSFGVYTGALNVTLTCDDGSGDGCDKTWYCTGSGCSPATEYSSTINISSSTELSFYSTDLASNSEAVNTGEYTIIIPGSLAYTGGDTGEGAGSDYLPGISRSDDVNESNNLDGGKARFDLLYNFTVVFSDDIGETPQLEPKLYIAHKNSPSEGGGGDFFVYDLTCTGTDWAGGKTCTTEISLGPAAVHKYFFYAEKTDSTPVRLPASGYLNGPVIKTLNGYAIVSAARDLDGETPTAAFGTSSVLEWVSGGPDTVFNASFNGGFQVPSTITEGKAYFISGASTLLPELAAIADQAAAYVDVPLAQGWNLIATPYNGNVKLNDVQIDKDSGGFKGWTSAATAGYNYNTLWNYDGSDWTGTWSQQSAGGVPDAILAPWMGYWMYVKGPAGAYTLRIPKPAQ